MTALGRIEGRHLGRSPLAHYRRRPVAWGWLAGLAAGWLLAAGALAGLPDDPGTGVTVLRLAALLLGVGGAVLAAPETDPPRDLLRATPTAHWRTLASRLAGWLALGTAPILALAVLLDGAGGWTAADLARGVWPNFLLVTATGFLAASLTSTLGGGAAAPAVVLVLYPAGRMWPAGFPVQLGAVPGGPHWQASRAWLAAVSVILVAITLLVERRAGLGPVTPGRLSDARSGP
jgi:hypothetical protein